MDSHCRLITQDGMAQVGEAPPKLRLEPRPYKSVKLNAAELDRVVGRYAVDSPRGPMTLHVERRDRRLVFMLEGALNAFLPLLPEAPLEFVTFGPGQFRFITDENGAVSAVEGTYIDGMPIQGKLAARPSAEKAGTSQ